MKNILTILTSLILFPAVVNAYQVGGRAKSNFGPATPAQENAAAPAVQTRSFTSYGSRQNRQNTPVSQPVSEQTAQEIAEMAPQPVAQHTKGSAPAQENKKTSFSGGVPAAPKPTQASTQPATGDAASLPPQAVAAMQQLQNMQNMMQSFGGGSVPQNDASKSGNGTPAAGGSAMSIPGMPDFSSLMNPGAQPAKK